MKNVPNIAQKYKREILQLRGINYSDNLQDGDLADSKNISADKFPYITTAKKTKELEGTGYTGVKALSSYQHLLTFRNDEMYIDGKKYIDIPTSEKQTVIVNGKMLVLPDEELVSLQNNYTLTDSNVSDASKFFAWLEKKGIYPVGTHNFYGKISEKTVSEINADRYHTTAGDNTYSYYRMSDSGDIKYGNLADTQTLSVTKGDIVGVKFAAGSTAVCKKGVSKPFNYTRATAEEIAALPEYQDTQDTTGSLYLMTTISPGRIFRVTYPTGYYIEGQTKYKKAISLEHDTSGVLTKTVDEINAISEYSSSASTTNYIVTDSGSIGSLTVNQYDWVQLTYTSQGNVYYNTVTAADSTEIQIPSDEFTESTDKWLYVFGSYSFVITDIAKLGLNFAKSGNCFYSFAVTNSSNLKRSIASVAAKCTSKAGTQGTYNAVFGDFLHARTEEEQGSIVEVTYGSNSVTGEVTALTQNTSSTDITISGFTPTTNQWYCFKLLEEPDFACEWANRLWCCNNDKQIIYASAQGKPDDFKSDADIATGSYSVRIGDVEPFTACSKYGSSILFFKQNRIYKIMGSSPKNYEIFTYETEGVKEGCHKSLCTINNVLYYVGLHGVYAYTGGSPVLISSRLGNIEMNNAVGGTDGERYFLSFESDGKDYMFTYEPKYNIWLKRDDIKAADFARKLESLYYLDKNTDKVIEMDTADTPDEMEWYAQFTPFYETLQGRKKYTKLFIRYELGNKSHMTIKIRQDEGLWQEVGKLLPTQKKGAQSFVLPIVRCDKMELRIEGKGKCTILELAREFEVGSDV